jgi:hypothetical protein
MCLDSARVSRIPLERMCSSFGMFDAVTASDFVRSGQSAPSGNDFAFWLDGSRTGSRSGFSRLANALSVLYPKESEQKRLSDAMLLAVPR